MDLNAWFGLLEMMESKFSFLLHSVSTLNFLIRYCELLFASLNCLFASDLSCVVLLSSLDVANSILCASFLTLSDSFNSGGVKAAFCLGSFDKSIDLFVSLAAEIIMWLVI